MGGLGDARRLVYTMTIQVPVGVGTSGQLVDAVVSGSTVQRQVMTVGDPTSTGALVTVTTTGGMLVAISNPSTAVTVSNISTAVTITNATTAVSLSSAIAISSGTITLSSATSLSSGTVTLSSVPTVTATAATNPWSSAPGFNMPVVNASSGFLQTLPTSTGSLSAFTYVSSSSGNSNNVKGTPGALYGLFAFNSTVATRYLKIYNTTSAPTLGTTANQLLNIGLSGGGGASIPLAYGMTASNGLAFTITANAAATDTGVTGASDIILNLYYV